VKAVGGNDKLSFDLVRSVEINCTYTGDSFEETGFVCWPSRDRVSISFGALSRDRVSISSGDILIFVGVRLRFEKSSQRWRL